MKKIVYLFIIIMVLCAGSLVFAIKGLNKKIYITEPLWTKGGLITVIVISVVLILILIVSTFLILKNDKN